MTQSAQTIQESVSFPETFIYKATFKKNYGGALPNKTRNDLGDFRLSGLLGELLALPPTFELNKNWFLRSFPDCSWNQIRKFLAALEEKGYLLRAYYRDVKGLFRSLYAVFPISIKGDLDDPDCELDKSEVLKTVGIFKKLKEIYDQNKSWVVSAVKSVRETIQTVQQVVTEEVLEVVATVSPTAPKINSETKTTIPKLVLKPEQPAKVEVTEQIKDKPNTVSGAAKMEDRFKTKLTNRTPQWQRYVQLILQENNSSDFSGFVEWFRKRLTERGSRGAYANKPASLFNATERLARDFLSEETTRIIEGYVKEFLGQDDSEVLVVTKTNPEKDYTAPTMDWQTELGDDFIAAVQIAQNSHIAGVIKSNLSDKYSERQLTSIAWYLVDKGFIEQYGYKRPEWLPEKYQ